MDDNTQPQGDQSTNPGQPTPPPPPPPAGGQPPMGQPAGGQPAGHQPPPPPPAQPTPPPPAGGQPPVGAPTPPPVPGAPAPGQPPAGKPQNDLSGIMEENVDVSSLVANAGNQDQINEFITWAKTSIPPHPNTQFDNDKFIQLLAGSISLTQNEKKKIVESVPKLSQFQIDELMKIFTEEQQKFTELEKKHAEQMAELEKQHQSPEAKAQKEEENKAKEEEGQEADDIKKSLGL